MTLGKMLADASITLHDLAAHLDGLDHAGRMAFMGSSSKAEQRKLWHLAADAEPITYEHFVPEGTPATTEVIHHGRNTLPLFNSFQKRFAKDARGRLFGYNEGSTRPLIGPGYYLCVPTAGNTAWEERGAWVVDYFQTPEADLPVPAGWPKIKKNSQGLQVLVYHHTRDFMRKVSKHVSIGIAYKNETCLNNWFTLVREDA